MKTLTSKAVFEITNFVNERSVEKTDIIHKRDENENLVVTLTTELQPGVITPKGNRRQVPAKKITKAVFDPITGEVLGFDGYINVGVGPEDFTKGSVFDLMPTYHERTNTTFVQAW